MTKELRDTPQFYLTAPTPCPYLPGRLERKVFTHLIGRRASVLNNALTQSGFRRSQTIAYRPACDGCNACVSVRILVDHFTPNRTMRRIMRRNADITARLLEPQATSQEYSLFRGYVGSRHNDGGMADMSALDFSMMVEDTHVDTVMIEYWHQNNDGENTLLACCLTDMLQDGLSMVYSFYEPDETGRSLGVHMILDHIARTRALGLPHLYLGYWIEGSGKMGYKSRYLPQERLGMSGWELII